jgi:hypothetical protein
MVCASYVQPSRRISCREARDPAPPQVVGDVQSETPTLDYPTSGRNSGYTTLFFGQLTCSLLHVPVDEEQHPAEGRIRSA